MIDGKVIRRPTLLFGYLHAMLSAIAANWWYYYRLLFSESKSWTRVIRTFQLSHQHPQDLLDFWGRRMLSNLKIKASNKEVFPNPSNIKDAFANQCSARNDEKTIFSRGSAQITRQAFA